MKHSIYAIAGATLLVAVEAANPAHADICDQFGSAVVARKYVVQNNRWNNNVPGDQCINVLDQVGNTAPGFSITKQTGSARTDGPPVSYPSIYLGCHYNRCSPDTNLPIQIKSIKRAETGINLKYVGDATFDSLYDIWLDPNPIKTGVNKQEIMIWLNKQGPIQPIGNKVGDVTIAGQNWQVCRARTARTTSSHTWRHILSRT